MKTTCKQSFGVITPDPLEFHRYICQNHRVNRNVD